MREGDWDKVGVGVTLADGLGEGGVGVGVRTRVTVAEGGDSVVEKVRHTETVGVMVPDGGDREALWEAEGGVGVGDRATEGVSVGVVDWEHVGLWVWEPETGVAVDAVADCVAEVLALGVALEKDREALSEGVQEAVEAVRETESGEGETEGVPEGDWEAVKVDWVPVGEEVTVGLQVRDRGLAVQEDEAERVLMEQVAVEVGVGVARLEGDRVWVGVNVRL